MDGRISKTETKTQVHMRNGAEPTMSSGRLRGSVDDVKNNSRPIIIEVEQHDSSLKPIEKLARDGKWPSGWVDVSEPCDGGEAHIDDGNDIIRLAPPSGGPHATPKPPQQDPASIHTRPVGESLANCSRLSARPICTR